MLRIMYAEVALKSAEADWGIPMDLRLGAPLYRRICQNLARLDVRSNEKGAAKQAAVALTIVGAAREPGRAGSLGRKKQSRAASLILTRRSSRLKNHAGQWALPGGRLDEGECPEEAALRELEEEVGVRLDQNRLLGRLDDYKTRSGFNITPVVVWGGADVSLSPNPAEVSSVHRIPIAEFMRKDAPVLETIPQSSNPVLLMPVGQSWIAAPTAAMIYQFREVAILGRSTRVSHYEQPLFAWY